MGAEMTQATKRNSSWKFQPSPPFPNHHYNVLLLWLWNSTLHVKTTVKKIKKDHLFNVQYWNFSKYEGGENC